MPEFGTSNRVGLRYIAEMEWGETPTGTITLQPVRFTSESLNYNADFVTSEEIRADRMTPDTVQVASSASGDINGEWSFSSYDAFIEAALYSSFVTTGMTVEDSTTAAIVKTTGTPNTWMLTDSAVDLSGQSWAVGQFIKVVGFEDIGTFYAQIKALDSDDTITIEPMTDVESDAAGDSITITPLEYVRNGIEKKSFTVQKAFTDLSTPEYWNFTGVRISTWNLELATGSILNTSFSILARDALMTETQFPDVTIGDAETTSVLNSVNNVASIVFDGDPAGSLFYFSQLSLSLDNQLRGQESVGTLGFIGVEAGRIALTGSIELYFENSSLADRFRAATSFSLSLLVQDAAGNVYIVTIPRAKYTSMEIVAGGLDQDILASAEFEAIINEAGTYQYQISRLAA